MLPGPNRQLVMQQAAMSYRVGAPPDDQADFDANPKHSEISAISARDSYWCNSLAASCR